MSKKKVKTDTGRRFPLSAGSDFVRPKAKQQGLTLFPLLNKQKRKAVKAESVLRTYDLTFSSSHTAEPQLRERQLVERLNAFALAAL